MNSLFQKKMLPNILINTRGAQQTFSILGRVIEGDGLEVSVPELKLDFLFPLMIPLPELKIKESVPNGLAEKKGEGKIKCWLTCKAVNTKKNLHNTK